MPSVIDFGADPTGHENSTVAFQAAFAAHPGKDIWIPAGTYLLGANAMDLSAAGTRWIGASKYTTKILVDTGTIGSICTRTSGSTSAYCGIENLQFDMGGEDCVAVDLSSINNAVVRDCFFKGATALPLNTTNGSNTLSTGAMDLGRLRSGQLVFGPNIQPGTTIGGIGSGTITLSLPATGTTGAPVTISFVAGVAIKFDDPTLTGGAYNNLVIGCAGESLTAGVEWVRGANIQNVFACEWINCYYAYYLYRATAAESSDTPRVIGGRVEGCNVGVLEGASGGYYLLRFENSHTADIEWTENSVDAVFAEGCATASSAAVSKNRSLATRPRILSYDLGVYDLYSGSFFTVAGLTPAGTPGRRAIVTDAMAPYTSANVGSTVAGGGYNTVPVFDNGTNWVIG